MIEFRPLTSFDELPEKAQERARESVRVWSLWYGLVNDCNDHTTGSLLHFGIIPTNAICAEGVVWAYVTDEGKASSRAVRRAALRAWHLFFLDYGWRLFAYCDMESPVNAKFLRFAGFLPTGHDEHNLYFERT